MHTHTCLCVRVCFNFVKLLQQRLHLHHMLNKLLTLRQPPLSRSASRAAVCFCLPTQICNDFFRSLTQASKCLPAPPSPHSPLPPAPTARAHNAFFIHTLQMKRAQLCDATGVRAACVCVCGTVEWVGVGICVGWWIHTHTQMQIHRRLTSGSGSRSLCTCVCACLCVCVYLMGFSNKI